MRCLLLLLGLLWLCPVQAHELLADVEVRVRWFEADLPIRGVIVHALNEEHNFVRSWKTDRDGKIHFQWPVGEELTLKLLPNNMNIGMQSVTFVVPEEGLTGAFGEITFQVASVLTYKALKIALQMKYYSLGAEDTCNIITTVTPPDKNLNDCPHGLAGVQVELDPPDYDQKYYFGIIERGPLQCKTDLLSFFGLAGLNYLYHRYQRPFQQMNREGFSSPIQPLEMDRTTEDGGVMFLNVKVRDEPYTVVASDPTNPRKNYTSLRFYCLKGGLVNASPPHGIKPIRKLNTTRTYAREISSLEVSTQHEQCMMNESYNEAITSILSDPLTVHHWSMLFQIFRESLHE